MNPQLTIKPEPFAYSESETFGPRLEGEAETAVNRKSLDHVRWVQQSLNQVMGLRLAVDGVLGPATRSAIRSFQQKQGLSADGIAGPKTEAALRAALGRSRKPSSPYPPVEQAARQTVYGWGQYRRRVEELPPDQKATLEQVGSAIVASYQPGQRPVRIVQVQGHADQDTPRNPAREQQVSEERAQQVTNWLKAYVGRPIAAQVAWGIRGLGATQLKAPPTTEGNRRQNRRVEILLMAAPRPIPPQPTTPTVSLAMVLAAGKPRVASFSHSALYASPSVTITPGALTVPFDQTIELLASGDPPPTGAPAYAWSFANQDDR